MDIGWWRSLPLYQSLISKVNFFFYFIIRERLTKIVGIGIIWVLRPISGRIEWIFVSNVSDKDVYFDLDVNVVYGGHGGRGLKLSVNDIMRIHPDNGISNKAILNSFVNDILQVHPNTGISYKPEAILNSFVNDILQIHPDTGISNKAILNSFVNDILQIHPNVVISNKAILNSFVNDTFRQGGIQ